jgi:hypothetical protein
MPRLPWYPPTNAQERSLFWITLLVLLLGMLSMLPGLASLHLGFGPVWSRASMLLSMWQIGMAIWIMTIPDWSALRVALWGYALLATLYGGVMAVCLATPRGQMLLWDLTDVRERAIPWCGGMAFFCLLTAYVSGTLMSRWQRQVRKVLRTQESVR